MENRHVNHVIRLSASSNHTPFSFGFPPPPDSEGNSTVVTESNGESAPCGEPGESWSAGLDGIGGGPVVQFLEEKEGIKVPDLGEDRGISENSLKDEGVDDRPLEVQQNCETLSPPDQEGENEGPGDDSPTRATIIMVPIEGSNAELRMQLMKAIRKPGRSESRSPFLYRHRHFLFSYEISCLHFSFGRLRRHFQAAGGR